MKDLVLRSADKTVEVHYLVDLIGDNEGITTIHEIRGLSDAEIALGIKFKRELYTLGELRKFALDNSLGLFAYETGKPVAALVDFEPTLTLTIVDENGDPIEGVSVSTDDENDDDEGTTDLNGEIEIRFDTTGIKTILVERPLDDDDDDDDSDTRVFASQTFEIDMFADQEKTLVLYEVESEDDDS